MIISIATTCPVCHTRKDLDVDEEGYLAWKSGTHIQDALPRLNDDQREALMTGFCVPCWNQMFSADPEAEYVEATSDEEQAYITAQQEQDRLDEDPADKRERDMEAYLRVMEERAECMSDYLSSGETQESLDRQFALVPYIDAPQFWTLDRDLLIGEALASRDMFAFLEELGVIQRANELRLGEQDARDTDLPF